MPWFAVAVHDLWMHATEAACLGQWRAEIVRYLEEKCSKSVRAPA